MPSEPHAPGSEFWSDPITPEEPESLGFLDSLGPAFRLENEVVSAVRAVRGGPFQIDGEFDLSAALKKSPLSRDHASSFVGVGSQDEFDYRSQVIEQELADRQALSASGVSGILAGMLAGVVSPTTLIPMVGPARGVKGVAQAFGLAAAAVSAQELTLQLTQQTRSAEEGVVSIAAGTVLAGLLGSAATLLRPDEFSRIAAGIDLSRGETSIYPSIPLGTAKAAGAQVTLGEGAGRLKAAPGITTLAQISPVTRVINDQNSVASRFMAQLSSAGLMLERNIEGVATAVDGTVEARIKGWADPLARSLDNLEERFADYWLETDVRVARQTRARLGSFFAQPGGGKLTFDEFKHAVARAMFSSDKHEVPEVAAAAEFFRKELYDPMLKEAQSVGLLPEDIDLRGAESYLNRLYDINMIVSRPEVFLRKLAEHIEQKLQAKARERLLKVKERNEQALQDIEDLTRSADEVEQFTAAVEAELKRMEDDPLALLADELSEAKRLSSTARRAQRTAEKEAAVAGREAGVPQTGLTQGQQLIADLQGRSPEDVLAEGGEALTKYLADRAKLRRRLRNLGRTAVGREKKQRRALDLIEKIEDQNLAALRRVGNKALAIKKKLDRISDDKLDAELSRLRDQFVELDALMQRMDEQLAKLEGRFEEGIFESRGRRISGKQRDELAKEVEAALLPKVEARKIDDTEFEVGNFKVSQTTKGRWFYQAGSGKRVFAETFEEARDAAVKKVQSRGVAKPVLTALKTGIADAAAGRVANPPSGAKSSAAYTQAYNAFVARKGELADTTQTARESTTALVETGLEAEARQERRGLRLSDVAEQIEEAQAFDREAAREAVDEAYQAVLARVNQVNSKRALREQKLRERVARYDPAKIEDEVAEIRGRADKRLEDFTESVRTKADEFDLETGNINFTTHARELAEELRDKIVGTDRRIVGLDILVGERGPELARLLDIDEREFSDFLIFDIEHLTRAYSRTMGSDIEMTRTFGSPNAVEMWRQLEDSFKQEIAALVNNHGQQGHVVMDKLVKSESLEGLEKDLDSTMMKEFRALHKRQKNIREDLAVVIDRLRHRRGIPENADGMMYRMGKATLALNTLRLMGMVVVSSIPDIARPVMKYGLINVFHDGFVPMITNWKQFKMIAGEAKAAGVGLDTILASRAASIFDIFDDVGRGTRSERALQFAANNFGNIAGFNQWTSAMKQFTAVIVHGQLYRSMKTLLEANDAGPKQVAKATEFLASLGIDNTNIRLIWDELNTHSGGDEVGGVRWPNTANWTDPRAKRAYRAAMAQAVDDTIVTPGVERPNWVDHNVGLRLVSQFRSFGFSSTTKTMMANLQQRDMAVVNGMGISLALGALSYYLWAVATGGDAYEEMLAAGPDKWADEAIDRSGLLAVLGEVRRVGERIPLTAPFASFSGQRTTRRQGADIVDAILGPSAGLAKTAGNVLMGLDDPTESTLHQFRKLTPFQNVFYLRQVLDKVEQGVAEGINLPERRQ